MMPVESIVKIIGLTYHIYREPYDGHNRRTEDHYLTMEPENSHHVCMISGFYVGAIVEILVHYGVPFPHKIE